MTRRNRLWTWGVAGLGLAFLGGCAEMQAGKSKQESPVAQAQKESSTALKRASDAQKAAETAQAKATQAQSTVDQDRQKLTQDEQNAQRLRAEAQQAQARAQQETQQANQQAQQNQQKALTAQQQQQQDRTQQQQAFHQSAATTRGQSISGQIVQVSPNKLVLKPQNQPEVSLNVSQDANVMLNGKKVSVSQLPQGAQARASYELENGQFQLRSLDAISP